MKLLLSYGLVVSGLCSNIKSIQLLASIFSIIVYLLLTSYYPIGGDYKSLQLRADSLEYSTLKFNSDIIFDLLARLSKILSIDVPIFYSILIISLLPMEWNKPHLLIFGLIISYYFLITGFQRQALSALVFARSYNVTFVSMRYTGFLVSLLTHKSVIMLIGLSLIMNKTRSIYFSGIMAFILFTMIASLSQIFDNTFLFHYIQYYFVDQMKSEGAFLRLVTIIIVYIGLVYKNTKNRDPMIILFEVITICAGLSIISGSTTAGDRILIFSLALLICSNLVRQATHARLIIVSAPFIIMNLFWVFLSKYAQANW